MGSPKIKYRGAKPYTGPIPDYDKENASQHRLDTIAAWQRHFPEAAKEESAHLHPLVRINYTKVSPSDPDEIWTNDVYQVTLRRKEDKIFGTGTREMIQLGISALDGTARHDWREFQAIKNQLAGAETEGFELYPAESRLNDSGNHYILWAFPGLKKINVGEDNRRVWDQDEAIAPQRKL